VSEAQLKGSAYHSTLAFIDAQFGEDARQRVLRRLSDEDRALVGGIMLPIQWYPLAPFPRLLRAMEDELGKGDLALVTDRGAWAAVHDMNTVHKVLLKLVTPSWLIEKGMRLWPSFHSSGRWEVARVGDAAARAELHDLGVVDDAMCATLKGWILGLLTLSGVRRPRVSHTECRVRGARSCVYDIDWH
jgi:hypothetical protein